MGVRGFMESISAFFRERWQPLAAIAAVAAVSLALSRLRPPAREISFDALLADVLVLRDAGAFLEAANSVANLLALDPALPKADQATLHAVLSDIIFRAESLRPAPIAGNVRKMIESQERAIEFGYRITPEELFRRALAHEWLKEAALAFETYQKIIARDPQPETRRDALQALIRLVDGRPNYQAERRGWIEELLGEDAVSPDYLWWALRQAVQESLDQSDIVRARALVARHAERFQRSDLRGYYEYFWAWINSTDGMIEEAAPQIAWIEEWLRDRAHETASVDMARGGLLSALTRWLRARIELADHRPQDALRSFDEALALQPNGELVGLCAIGRAQALALLERHAAAQNELRAGRTRIGRESGVTLGWPRLRKAALELAAERDQRGAHAAAVDYLLVCLELSSPDDEHAATGLDEAIARQCELAARDAQQHSERRRYLIQAGERYERAARAAAMAPEHAADLIWQSSQAFDAAGESAATRRVLGDFVAGRTDDERLPLAITQLGQASAAEGDCEAAIEWYQRLIDEYPRLQDAAKARLLAAECLLSMGESRAAEAEQQLVALLEDDLVTPDAAVFRDSLLGLSELLYEQKRFAAAISRLDNFLALYADDPDRRLAMFLLADSYRRSALTLRDAAPPGADPEHARAESRNRLKLSSDYFSALAQEAPLAPDDLPYQRLAQFYHADCLFELNEPDALAAALEAYRQAAARYATDSGAIVAHVQMANILLRQGKLTEAARSVERARWLLRSIPDAALATPGGADRSAWDQFFARVASSSLFKDLLVEP